MATLASKLDKKSKFLIFGGGFSGRHFANEIRKMGFEVLTSYRNNKSEKNSFFFDSNSEKIPSDDIFKDTTHILSCIPPNENGRDPVLFKLKKKLQGLSLKWAGYLSTTGVYGNTFGQWVSEKDPANPLQERSKRRLICEKEWLNSELPSQIFRLPGIYGPGRSTIESIIRKNIKVISKPKQVFSRIHVEDISMAIIYLLQNTNNIDFHQIINISDNYPCSQVEVIEYSYKLLGLKMPNPIEFEEAKKILSPIALSFWEENRKVSNKLLCEDLGYKLIHKDYTSGLKNCLQQVKSFK
ncbi:MAG: NAD(P)-dependent oxidoreductase [Prochlorococcus sp. SP3034]|nr:NAD(P)-dependent oxidoreductase [Prochlorococcus sp. SP3034]|tara:strand:+ start:2118 stop:3008 length:891 start_codon:yes stop_codon:yes gene_type:complete